MALLHVSFFSDVLEMVVNMDVILPQITKYNKKCTAIKKDGTYPTLYLFHGLSDDHTMWMRYTSIERYVSKMGIAVVMPNVHQSFYSNMCHGLNYWDFISQELKSVCHTFFPNMSKAREDNFAAGISMGGYGAVKLGFAKPDEFAAVASLSGALDLVGEMENEHSKRPDHFWEMVFGSKSNVAGSENDLFTLAEKQLKLGKKLPTVYQWCGTEDFLYEPNIHARDIFRKLGIDLTYNEGKGNHDWKDWDSQIQKVLEWLPIQKQE